MKIFKHNGQYYLKKMQNGELTNQQVADILNVTVNTVNSEYNDYSNYDFNNLNFYCAIHSI